MSNTHQPSSADPPKLSIKEELERLLEQNLDPASLQAKLLDLAKHQNRSLQELERLLSTIEATREQHFALTETTEHFNQLLELEAQRLDLHRVLPPNLADPMLATAAALPTTPSALLTTFLPTAASRVGSASRIVVKSSSGYTLRR